MLRILVATLFIALVAGCGGGVSKDGVSSATDGGRDATTASSGASTSGGGGSSSGGDGTASSSSGSSSGKDAATDGSLGSGSASGGSSSGSPCSSSSSGSVSSSGLDGGAEAESEGGGDGGIKGPPSCAPGGNGLTNCGSCSESCCTSLEVPGGTFYRTYDPTNADGGATLAADGGPTGLADPATVSAFRLDKYDVTVGRFRQFVTAWNNGYRPPAGSGKHTHLNGGAGLVDVGANPDAGVVYETGWATSDDGNVSVVDTCSDGVPATWTTTPGNQENLPINCVRWPEAYAFCIWDSGFLPTEAEWEFAAAGGNQQREYPWGATAPGTANQYAIYGCYYPSGSTCTGTGVRNIAPVGTATLGAGLWGQLDLAGNVSQWTLDLYSVLYAPCTDCANLTQGSDRVLRGSTYDGVIVGYPTGRFSQDHCSIGLICYTGDGFRCARTP